MVVIVWADPSFNPEPEATDLPPDHRLRLGVQPRRRVMSVTNAASFEHLNGHEIGTAGQASSGTHSERHGGRSLQDDGTQSTQRLKQARSVLDVAADEEAFRLRASGMTYRQIGEKMGVDQSMAHRRVKRQMMRQKMYLNEKLEEARDFELDKLRQMEQAILPDATSGDHSAIKLVLRIMEMRRKYLKDIPLERGDLFPSIEDRAELLAEVVDAALQEGTGKVDDLAEVLEADRTARTRAEKAIANRDDVDTEAANMEGT